MPVPLPDELLDLLGRPSLCFIATIMPNGSPQLTQTWVSTDGEHILINTPDHSQKARNVARDPHVAVNVVDPDNTRRYFAVRGRVIAATTEGGAQSIDERRRRPNSLGLPHIHNRGAGMRIESSVTSVSWIPSESVSGLYKAGFAAGASHPDDPPPDVIGDVAELDELFACVA